MFTYKLRKGPKVGLRPNDRLDASTSSRVKTNNRVMIRASEWGESQLRDWAFEWENPSSGVGFTIGFLVSVLLHQRSCELGNDLKLGCNPSTDWMFLI